MLSFILRRMGYGAAVVFGVLGFLFILFFAVTTPDDMAYMALGERAQPQAVENWKENHGYNKPLFPQSGAWTDNLLVEHYHSMLTFNFGRSDADNKPISERLRKGAGPSLSLTVPLFILQLLVALPLAMLVAFFRETYIDRLGVVLSVFAMSVSILLYIIGSQYLVGRVLHWFPISGFDSDPTLIFRFLALPVFIGVIAGIGSDIRFYRTVFLAESNADYVRTARAKGAGEMRIMFRHVFRNSLIPVITHVVLAIPFLFMGSLLLEAFFGIPGLGSMTVEAIHGNDFSVLRTMVYIGALAFVGGQILTDICYALVDPRVRLK